MAVLALTADELEAEVKANLGNRSDLDTRLIRFINMAQDKIARAHRWRCLEGESSGSCVAGTEYITVTSDETPVEVLGIRLDLGTSDSRNLIYIPRRKWDVMFPDLSWQTQGKPTHYTLVTELDTGLRAWLWRVPDDTHAYKVRLWSWPTALTTGGGTASDLKHLDEVIVSLATAYAFRSLGEHEEARGWMSSGRLELGQAIKQDSALAAEDISADIPDTTVGDYWLQPFIKTMP